MSNETIQILLDPRLATAFDRIGKILAVSFESADDTAPIDRLSRTFRDINVCIGFLSGLADSFGVPSEVVGKDALSSQKAGHEMLRLIGTIPYQIQSEDRTDESARTARVMAGVLANSPELLELLNELTVVTHADLAQVK